MRDSLKFCMITTFYPPYSFGGDAIYIYRLSNELARRGHSVDVVHCEDAYQLLQTNGLKGNYPNHPGVKLHRLKSRAGFLSPLLTQQTGIPFFKGDKIKALLEKQHFDVIHYHNMSLIGLRTFEYGEAIKLYTTHEHWLVCPMHVLWKYNREVCTQKSCISCQLVGKRPPQLWRYTGLIQRMIPYIDRFISPSRFTLQKHLEFGLNIPIVHLPYFLATTEEQEDETSSEAHDNGGRPYFLFVGRLEKIKGLQNLIPVFQKHPEYDLFIAGDGTYEMELRQMAGAAQNIRFFGKLNHEKLRALYRGTTAVIVPSICYEVFGIIIIESFSMKAPVIVNNLGALPEVVEDSGGGFIYNNETELVDAMHQLAGSRDLRNRLGEAGHKAYLKYWSEESHIEQYFQLIDDVRAKKNQYQEVSV
jgi:glycosyltransferase involved in cell wall biosynthesis